MEIILSRKTIAIASVIVALLIIGSSGYYVRIRGILKQWLPTNSTASQPATDEPALTAASTIFSPSLSAGSQAWETQVCANMTADGCQLFSTTYAPSIWSAAQAGKMPTPFAIRFASTAEKLPDGAQIWKLSTSDPTNPLIYVQVAKDPVSQKWLLVRLLFSQETQQRYGN